MPEMELIWKGAAGLLVVLFVVDYFMTAWRVRRIARDMRRVVSLLDRLVELQSSQHLMQRVGTRDVGDVQLRSR
jgi:hypothetical protein